MSVINETGLSDTPQHSWERGRLNKILCAGGRQASPEGHLPGMKKGINYMPSPYPTRMKGQKHET